MDRWRIPKPIKSVTNVNKSKNIKNKKSTLQAPSQLNNEKMMRSGMIRMIMGSMGRRSMRRRMERKRTEKKNKRAVNRRKKIYQSI